ncbi:MAG: hypothetical protein JSS63_15120 [Bacteroidetes bacterium]|mgnify:CR=1 FL=1|nr:hypothetical protein [Bacteroidota bacterium]
MKKIFALAILICAIEAFGQMPNTTYVTPYLGAAVPSNLSNYKSSFTAGANFEFALTKAAVFGFDVNFANLISKNNSSVFPAVLGYTYYGSGNYATMGFMVFAKLQNAEAVKSPVQPFVKIGAGTSLISQTEFYSMINGFTNLTPVSTSTGLLFAPSLGANIMIHSKNKIVLEAQYRINKSDTDDVRQFLFTLGYSFRL